MLSIEFARNGSRKERNSIFSTMIFHQNYIPLTRTRDWQRRGFFLPLQVLNFDFLLLKIILGIWFPANIYLVLEKRVMVAMNLGWSDLEQGALALVNTPCRMKNSFSWDKFIGFAPHEVSSRATCVLLDSIWGSGGRLMLQNVNVELFATATCCYEATISGLKTIIKEVFCVFEYQSYA